MSQAGQWTPHWQGSRKPQPTALIAPTGIDLGNIPIVQTINCSLLASFQSTVATNYTAAAHTFGLAYIDKNKHSFVRWATCTCFLQL